MIPAWEVPHDAGVAKKKKNDLFWIFDVLDVPHKMTKLFRDCFLVE